MEDKSPTHFVLEKDWAQATSPMHLRALLPLFTS